MSKQLIALVDALTDRGPTVQQVDDMLGELSLMPRDATIADLIDRLLDYRGAAGLSTPTPRHRAVFAAPAR